MKVGDLVKFWDYEGGHGFVEGLVLGVDDYQYSSKLDPVPSACVLLRRPNADCSHRR